MADYAISNVPRRVVYAPSGVGPYAFTFEILDQTDIAVYKGSTLLTLTTDYTVSINGSTGTGEVTLVATAGTDNVTIVGAKNIQRTSDFSTGGDLFADTLNDELDNQTIFAQQVAETAERALKAPVTDPTDIAMTLPDKASRANRYLGFDLIGNPIAVIGTDGAPGTMGGQFASAVSITGGSIDGTTIGGTTRSTGNFTNLTTSGTINSLTVGRGNNNVSSNTAVGLSALANNSFSGIQNVGIGGSALTANTIGSYNVAVGNSALQLNTTGSRNTAIGWQSLAANTTAGDNTAIGYQSLALNTTGYFNTAIGYRSLLSNTTGYFNIATGHSALLSNTTGDSNSAYGNSALQENISGAGNSAFGYRSLFNNTTGTANSSTGMMALQANTTGNYNTANGYFALLSNIDGTNCTAIGYNSMRSNTSASYNTALGSESLYSNTTGSTNSAISSRALYSNTTGSGNTAVGHSCMLSNTTGGSNVAVGAAALQNATTGSGNTSINEYTSGGSRSPVYNITTENNRFCAGSTAVTNAYIQVAWTVVSDARDKADFAEIPHGLDFVSKLKPTAYRYKMNREDTEGHGPVRYGFKAQDVLELEGNAPVIVDAEDLEKLRFNDQSMIAVLVKAIQELKSVVDSQAERIAILETRSNNV